MESKNGSGTPPEKKFSAGAISATIWKNNSASRKNGKAVEFRSIVLQRRYTDKEGKWQTSSSLRLSDLPKASLVLQKAYEYLVLKSTAEAPGVETATPVEEIDM